MTEFDTFMSAVIDKKSFDRYRRSISFRLKVKCRPEFPKKKSEDITMRCEIKGKRSVGTN